MNPLVTRLLGEKQESSPMSWAEAVSDIESAINMIDDIMRSSGVFDSEDSDRLMRALDRVLKG